MQRSLLSRSLEPLVAILWGLFLVWTIWLAAVWLVPIGANALGLADDGPPPPNADFRSAVLLFANYADLAWLALAVMNLHLVLTRAHGLRTARVWLAFSGGAGLLLGLAQRHSIEKIASIYFGDALGATFLGVAIGWVLLWAVLVMSAREAVIWIRPRGSHRSVALFTAALVTLTLLDLEWPARFIRGWWVWRTPDARSPLDVPLLRWVACFVWAGLTAFAMREKDVISGAKTRSAKPAIILAALNVLALATIFRSRIPG